MLPETAKLTYIADRASDVYELLARVPDHRTELLIRSNHNRNIGRGGKLRI
ncbi:MAG: hypothetical protein R3B47_12425 [Bacteroidia bacterium]